MLMYSRADSWKQQTAYFFYFPVPFVGGGCNSGGAVWGDSSGVTGGDSPVAAGSGPVAGVVFRPPLPEKKRPMALQMLLIPRQILGKSQISSTRKRASRMRNNTG